MKGCSAILAWNSNWGIRIRKIKIWSEKSRYRCKYDIMSVSEREQAMLVHRERRMAIMIAAYAASSTKGANHDIIGE